MLRKYSVGESFSMTVGEAWQLHTLLPMIQAVVDDLSFSVIKRAQLGRYLTK